MWIFFQNKASRNLELNCEMMWMQKWSLIYGIYYQIIFVSLWNTIIQLGFPYFLGPSQQKPKDLSGSLGTYLDG